MIYIFSFVIISYLVLHIIYLKGYFKSKNSSKLNSPVDIPVTVTVIVAAKNEENTIIECIDSLKKLNYPKSLFEVIFVNDNSDDNTEKVIINNITGFDNFKLLNSVKEDVSNLKGKANAIDTGISNSSGKIIFITDADCIVPANWIKETIKYYDEDNTAMVCGFTNIKDSGNLFSILQSLDWIYLLSLASCSSGINRILSCIGNNISFRKDVYTEIGGYKNIKFSITEDLALLRKIDSIKKYKIKYPIDSECSVKTTSCKNFKEFYLQKKRWFKGATGINYLGYIYAIEFYIVNLILFFGLLFLSPVFYIIFVFAKLLSELIIFIPVYINLKFKHILKYYILFQIYYGIYGLLLPLSFIFGNKVNWKGRKY